ncbi:MAG: SemiSWEET transporter [Hyphomicrobiaceae bacterium]|nr:SemiSWEET transporter [Hyphomicrobiaceae bacterium]
MSAIETVVGAAAAVCTTIANVPQVAKTWRTRRADDLSLKMLILLMSGIALWLVYGLLKWDLLIILANIATFALLAVLLYVKLGYPAEDGNRHNGSGSAATGRSVSTHREPPP